MGGLPKTREVGRGEVGSEQNMVEIRLSAIGSGIGSHASEKQLLSDKKITIYSQCHICGVSSPEPFRREKKVVLIYFIFSFGKKVQTHSELPSKRHKFYNITEEDFCEKQPTSGANSLIS